MKGLQSDWIPVIPAIKYSGMHLGTVDCWIFIHERALELALVFKETGTYVIIIDDHSRPLS